MTDKRGNPSNPTGRGHTQDGYQPPKIDGGHQPAYTPSNPGAGHQPAGTGTPQPPTTGSGVKPAPAKK